MRGMEQLQTAKQEQQRLHTQVIEAAQKAADRVANVIAQDIQVGEANGVNYEVFAINAQKWGMQYRNPQRSDPVPHTQWSHEDACMFGQSVQEGLVEKFAELVQQENQRQRDQLNWFASHDMDIPVNTNGLSDQDLITALAMDAEEAGCQCIECGKMYTHKEAAHLKNKSCVACGKHETVVPLSALPGGKPVTGRSQTLEELGIVQVC